MGFAALIPVAALAAVAAAAPSALEVRASSSSCDTGSVQCCTQYYSQYEYESQYSSVLQALGINLSNYQGLVGTQCTGSTVCDQQPVCCTGNSFNGLVVVGCSPITING
ncbi:hydrophobin [Butyriboletus roseoflavus]|nr:hydrophobin [Butyriboletus roseoflavus]